MSHKKIYCNGLTTHQIYHLKSLLFDIQVPTYLYISERKIQKKKKCISNIHT